MAKLQDTVSQIDELLAYVQDQILISNNIPDPTDVMMRLQKSRDTIWEIYHQIKESKRD